MIWATSRERSPTTLKRVRLKPDYSGAYFTIAGLSNMILGDKQGAIADYTEVVRLKPDDADAYYNRGIAKSDLGNKQGCD